MATTDRNAGPAQQEGSQPGEGAPHLRSDELLRGHRRLIIEHTGEHYCLRLTRNERLILTKL
ncbi:MAG: hemin uptake protein HemP [Nitrococcus sp.]|nr:hemin uptake protein HemP [Nitrococcus sp.]